MVNIDVGDGMNIPQSNNRNNSRHEQSRYERDHRDPHRRRDPVGEERRGDPRRINNDPPRIKNDPPRINNDPPRLNYDPPRQREGPPEFYDRRSHRRNPIDSGETRIPYINRFDNSKDSRNSTKHSRDSKVPIKYPRDSRIPSAYPRESRFPIEQNHDDPKVNSNHSNTTSMMNLQDQRVPNEDYVKDVRIPQPQREQHQNPDNFDNSQSYKYQWKPIVNDSPNKDRPPIPSSYERSGRHRPSSVTSHLSMSSHMSRRSNKPPSNGIQQYMDPYNNGRQPQPQSAYDPQYMYSMYQYYGQHPYYRDYYRQFMKQQQYGANYPQPEGFPDDRTSTRSGRSSINDELKKSLSSLPPDYHDQSYAAPYLYQRQTPLRSYASGELSVPASLPDESVNESHQRLTPLKYGRPHLSANLTPGGVLVLVPPNNPKDGQPATVQIRDIQKMLCRDPQISKEIQQMKNYPGPLTISETHKDDVLRYCEQKKNEAQASGGGKGEDGDSIVLMWEYLALLVTQNGKLCGTDVANLLLGGRSQPSMNTTSIEATDTPSTITPPDTPDDGAVALPGSDVPKPSKMVTKDEAALTKKFREYVCLGRKKEAVNFAMREELWGYAMALASKMDTATHTRVMAGFMASLPHNDVLQTLFQQLSGKKPEITKSYSHDRWGNWRHHLAVLVSNSSGDPNHDESAINSLGDTLASRGHLHAAHFCYLVANANWGTYSDKTSRLALIGTSVNHPFQAFATNEAIQCTEVYEYAQSLNSNDSLMETFQSYKLVYAMRLTEYGFPSEALKYCEVISQSVNRSPQSYMSDFVSQVYQLALKLKYHDLHYQMGKGEIHDMPDPDWLKVLHQNFLELQYTYAENVVQGEDSSNQTQTPDVSCIPHSQTMTTESYYEQTPPEQPSMLNSNQELENNTTSGYSIEHNNQFQYGGGDNVNRIGAVHPSGETLQPVINSLSSMQVDPGTSVTTHADITDGYANHHQSNGAMWQSNQYQENINTTSSMPYIGHADPEVSTAKTEISSNVPQSLPPNVNYSGYDPPMWGSNSPPAPQTTAPMMTPEDEEMRSMLGNKKKKDSTESNVSSPPPDDDKEDNKDNDSKDKNKSGIFSSISSYIFKPRPNQVQLPDDKNPSIIWDGKKWTNKEDGDITEDAPKPKPPTMASQQGSAPANFRGPPRNRRYLDPIGEKDRVKPPSAGSVPPLPGGPPMGNLMVPVPLVPNQTPPQPTDTTQMERHRYYSHSSSIDLEEVEPMDGPQEIKSDNIENVATNSSSAPPESIGQPMFFNPAQFQPSNTTSNQVPGRRPGPSRRAFANQNQR